MKLQMTTLGSVGKGQFTLVFAGNRTEDMPVGSVVEVETKDAPLRRCKVTSGWVGQLGFVPAMYLEDHPLPLYRTFTGLCLALQVTEKRELDVNELVTVVAMQIETSSIVVAGPLALNALPRK